MKDGCNRPVKKSIDRMRQEMHRLIESEKISSDDAKRANSELEKLIVLYYSTLEQQKRNERNSS